jgi:hypothetical protein
LQAFFEGIYLLIMQRTTEKPVQLDPTYDSKAYGTAQPPAPLSEVLF